ncbi:Cys-tRNA(Pro) deacylase [Desulfuromonas carbonis]|uniref:Cys-tRNA(Pro) deacylase n=1 Tax=Desulfuromonas sp. DDH964 TaxID=1823759 RepID=UPI00078BEC6F|nr:Cys-tRNA(Pro) deacylase [Desulfuromonas sp. DDH964]AMV71706.1 misacylated tRNA(Pro) deacylase, YbaK/ProX family [Desulfuromonas sp. DDH964]
MARDKIPVTPAIRLLRQHQVPFTPHLYPYEERGGTAVSARELGVDEHRVIKTLVMEDDSGQPLIILMHGDRQVSARELARSIGARSVVPCAPQVADRHSGYQVGGTSPFATRKPMPVYMEETIRELSTLFVNGGKRGFLVEMTPADLERVLNPTPVRVGI